MPSTPKVLGQHFESTGFGACYVLGFLFLIKIIAFWLAASLQLPSHMNVFSRVIFIVVMVQFTGLSSAKAERVLDRARPGETQSNQPEKGVLKGIDWGRVEKDVKELVADPMGPDSVTIIAVTENERTILGKLPMGEVRQILEQSNENNATQIQSIETDVLTVVLELRKSPNLSPDSVLARAGLKPVSPSLKNNLLVSTLERAAAGASHGDSSIDVIVEGGGNYPVEPLLIAEAPESVTRELLTAVDAHKIPEIDRQIEEITITESPAVEIKISGVSNRPNTSSELLALLADSGINPEDREKEPDLVLENTNKELSKSSAQAMQIKNIIDAAERTADTAHPNCWYSIVVTHGELRSQVRQ